MSHTSYVADAGRLARSKAAYVRAATACTRSAAAGQEGGISRESTPATYASMPSVLTVTSVVSPERTPAIVPW